MLETGCIDVIAKFRAIEAICVEGMMPLWLDEPRGPSSTSSSKSSSHSSPCGRYHPYSRKKLMYGFFLMYWRLRIRSLTSTLFPGPVLVKSCLLLLVLELHMCRINHMVAVNIHILIYVNLYVCSMYGALQRWKCNAAVGMERGSTDCETAYQTAMGRGCCRKCGTCRASVASNQCEIGAHLVVSCLICLSHIDEFTVVCIFLPIRFRVSVRWRVYFKPYLALTLFSGHSFLVG